MDFQPLADTLDQLRQTSKRLEKTNILAQFLHKAPQNAKRSILLLLQGKVDDEYKDTKLGMSVQNTIKALAQAIGKPSKNVQEIFHQQGDIGLTAKELLTHKSQTTLFSETLTLEHVHQSLLQLTTFEGKNSTQQKIATLSGLFSAATANEGQVIAGVVTETLRSGVAAGVIRDAVLWSNYPELIKQHYGSQKDPINLEWITQTADEEDPWKTLQELQAILQHGIDVTSSLATTALTLEQGIDAVKELQVRVFRPFHAMLAQKTPSLDDAAKSHGLPMVAEYKYDGFRVQIHRKNNIIRLFTRRLEEVTNQFPDLQEPLTSSLPEHIIVDAEIVGIDKTTGKYTAFQNISQRIRRKHNIEQTAQQFPVEVRVFDIITLHEDSLIEKSLFSRREVLEKNLSENNSVKLSTYLLTDNLEHINEFYEQSLQSGNEGIMLKKQDSIYQPGSRVGTMLKYKPTMENLDVVITKAYRGQGKRSQWLTSFTIALKDEVGELHEVGKVSTGLKELDEEGISFNQMTQLLQQHIQQDHGEYVDITPEVIIEVAYEEIQASQSYSSGYALRFPRFVTLRQDRGLEDISDISYVEQLYLMQRGRNV